MNERTKQVQFRMPENLHKKLKITLIQNDSSLAEFFNNAALTYLENAEKAKQSSIPASTKEIEQ